LPISQAAVVFWNGTVGAVLNATTAQVARIDNTLPQRR
jgi:hypothetical protein